ncbi:MAG: hypothetical protein GQ540_03205 [Lutibacter sp.]|uniref:hypothetical protein n=1 Tax=Lutibacter sp. TaxID=1925666 RepID=UPI0019F5B5AD|nr:hypothetical protein [Lutibacter sp.]NOR27519.1 hypothetical protein [Lutibacter sp.]
MISVNEAFRNFLNRTTCYGDKSIHWQSPDNERFVIFKHHSHSTYVNRFTGSVNCEVYYALYDLHNIPDDIYRGEGCMLKFKGRWKKYNFELVDKFIKEYLCREEEKKGELKKEEIQK